MRSRGGMQELLAQAPLTIAAALVCVMLAGCVEDGVVCTAEYVPGITIEVRDAATGAPAACGATAWFISGSWSEMSERWWGCDMPDSLSLPILRGAYERSGVYTVLVLKDGYAPWSRDEIEVREDACHVLTVELKAMLIRNP